MREILRRRDREVSSLGGGEFNRRRMRLTADGLGRANFVSLSGAKRFRPLSVVLKASITSL
jgi:hypothetical protein